MSDWTSRLFFSRKAVEYHQGNGRAECGLQGRQQLRRFVEHWAQPAVAAVQSDREACLVFAPPTPCGVPVKYRHALQHHRPPMTREIYDQARGANRVDGPLVRL
jgi:hypothetical protein